MLWFSVVFDRPQRFSLCVRVSATRTEVHHPLRVSYLPLGQGDEGEIEGAGETGGGGRKAECPVGGLTGSGKRGGLVVDCDGGKS